MTTEVICFFLCHFLVKFFTNPLLCAMVVWLLFNSSVLFCNPPLYFFCQFKWTAHQVSNIPFCDLHCDCQLFYMGYSSPLTHLWMLSHYSKPSSDVNSSPVFFGFHLHFKNEIDNSHAHTLLSYLWWCCTFWTSLCFLHCWTNESSGYMLAIQEIFNTELWFQWALLELCISEQELKDIWRNGWRGWELEQIILHDYIVQLMASLQH